MDRNATVEKNTKVRKKRSPWRDIGRRLIRNKMAVAGLIILLIIAFAAIFANQIADYEKLAIGQNTPVRLQGPSKDHWLGTDDLGRDVFARIVHGARISLMVGFVAIGIALVVGGILGCIAGYYGGLLDNIIMRFMDIFLAIPSILLAVAIVAAFGGSLFNLMVAIGVSFIPQFARVVRASVLQVKDQEFVESAKAVGSNDFRIIVKHIIPNALAPTIVKGTLGVASAILSTAGLAFIGLAIPKPTPEWGSMLSDSRSFLRVAPHMAIFPGLAIMITILALNLLGDGLRDALDPKLK